MAVASFAMLIRALGDARSDCRTIIGVFTGRGETEYGEPLIERIIMHATKLVDSVKYTHLSSGSPIRGKLSVGLSIDLICQESPAPGEQRRIELCDASPFRAQPACRDRD
ncbi:hypothetical protein [Accumulibacter sp.]|uniref:hypothetical protein n=1 Tax=Accumulibacter sp. TaxID=2053492 RepID=UPI0025DDE7E7|nr:hypothetical protein [Accumulibacter sp.]MCP5228543.1 hypothetical protein [Accumulibacter sp.]